MRSTKSLRAQAPFCGFRPKMRNISSDQRLAPVKQIDFVASQMGDPLGLLELGFA